MDTSVPATLTAGTTVVFERTFGDYPAGASWVYSFVLAGAVVVTTAGVANGNAFTLTLTATVTAGLSAGTYRYAERVTKAGAVYEVGSGVLEVLPNLAAATAGSAQTHEEKTLAVIEAALSGRLSADVQEYTIGGRSISKIPILELEKLRGKYKARVWRQRNPGVLGPRVEVTFSGAT